MNMNNREDKDLAILCNAKSDDLKGLYDDVSNELYRYGGNTIITFFTHRGVEYRELVIDICQRLEVDFDKDYKKMVSEMTAAQVQQMAQKLLAAKRRIEVTMLSE